MKLTKDQTQKLVLGLMMLGIVIYAYIEFLLGPLTASQVNAGQELAGLDPKIKAAKEQIAKTDKMKERAPEAKLLMEQVNAMIPAGSPVAWFQPRVADFFKRYEIDKVAAKMNSEAPDRDVPGFRRVSWGLEFPKLEFMPFAHAIAALENEEPLFEIHAFDVEASREDLGSQRASLTITNLVR
jgi:hypothetical protein